MHSHTPYALVFLRLISLSASVCVCTGCIWACFLGLKFSGGNAATRAEIQDEMRSSDCVLIGCRDNGQFQSQFLPDSQSTNNPPQGSAEGYNRMPKRERQRIRIDVLCLDIVTGLQKHEAGGITSPALKSCVKKYIFLSRRAQIASQTNWSLLLVPADWSVSQALRTHHGLLRSDLLFTGIDCQCLPWTLD